MKNSKKYFVKKVYENLTILYAHMAASYTRYSFLYFIYGHAHERGIFAATQITINSSYIEDMG